MKTFSVVAINPSTNEQWQMHKYNCKDAIKQAHGHVEDLYTINSENTSDAEKAFFDEELLEMGYKPGDGTLRIMPCCKEATSEIMPQCINQ